jgi:hypothetical protein
VTDSGSPAVDAKHAESRGRFSARAPMRRVDTGPTRLKSELAFCHLGPSKPGERRHGGVQGDQAKERVLILALHSLNLG